MRQLINALLRYRNTILYTGLLIVSIIFLNHRSFYHQSIFSKISLAISSNLNQFGRNTPNYIRLASTNEKLFIENAKLKVFELIHL